MTAKRPAVVVGLEYLGEGGKPVTPFAGVSTAGKPLDFLWQEGQATPATAGVPDSRRFFWPTFDQRIAACEAAGIRRLVVVLRCKHPNLLLSSPTIAAPAEVAGLAALQASAPPVGEDSWAQFARWVGAVARRYRDRVVAYQIESEQTDPTHWLGTVDDYLRLFRVARAAILQADPGALVGLGGIGFGDALDDLEGRPVPELEATLLERVGSLGEPWRSLYLRAIDFGRRCLGELEYDFAGLHALSAASAIDPAARLLRAYMRDPAAALWIDDATSAPVCVYDPNGWNQPADPWSMLVELWRLMSNDRAAWARREAAQVEMIRAKIAAAIAAGCAWINFCFLGDWPPGSAFGTLPYQGLRRPDGSLRPACDVIRAAQG